MTGFVYPMDGTGFHYTVGDLEDLGESICQALLDEFKPSEQARQQAIREIESTLNASTASAASASSMPGSSGATQVAYESDSDDEVPQRSRPLSIRKSASAKRERRRNRASSSNSSKSSR